MSRDRATAEVERLAAQGCLIGDGWRPGGDDVHVHHDPSTGRAQAEVALASAADVDDAVRAARDALPRWRDAPPQRRAAVLFRLADLLERDDDAIAGLAALDNGTPVSLVRPARYTAEWTRYYAGWADKVDGDVVPSYSRALTYVRPEPYGVVAAIPPWNGSMMGMGQKVAPALAAGNTVVAKPPELAPFGVARFAELALEAGLPPGVLNVVPGGAGTGDALVRHPGVDKISFTGGTATARRIMAAAAETLTPLALELGGKSANIVFPDADLVAAMPASSIGAWLLTGQGCALPTRLYVHDDVYDEAVALLVDGVRAMTVGDPFDPATLVGPVITADARDRIVGMIDRAVAGGATVLLGGHAVERDGYYVEPTILGDVDQSSEVARDEVFGPVLAVLRFADEDEVVALANDSPFGLAAYVHTADLRRAHRVAHRLDAGMVVVGGGGLAPNTPFGGVKQSGFGREGGRAGIDEFLRLKTVTIGL